MLGVIDEFVTMFRQNAVIADSAVVRGLIDIKRAALLFENLVVLQTEQSRFDPAAKRSANVGLFGTETDWLIEQGVVRFERDLEDPSLAAHDQSYARDRKQVTSAICNLILLGSDPREVENWVRCGANGIARSTAAYLQDRDDIDYVPLIYGKQYELSRLLPGYPTATPTDQNRQTASAIRVIFNALPTPDDSTSWEDILDYRRDPAVFSAFARLRHWASETVRSGLPERELAQKLEYELHTYEDALRLHGIKARLQTLEALIATPLEIAENLVTLKWGEAAKALFAVGKQKIEVLESEQRLTGRDLHFLVVAKKRFGNQRRG